MGPFVVQARELNGRSHFKGLEVLGTIVSEKEMDPFGVTLLNILHPTLGFNTLCILVFPS